MRVNLLAALAMLVAPAALADGADPHGDEIRAFATTMAIARTVRDNCPDIAPDDYFLEALRQRLRVVDADHPAFAPVARAAAEALQKAVKEAPSAQAWCDATFGLYGTEGKLMR
jgi:acetylornithine deacetylase/succinyl-diaminopimelate desuccinylase-like protein